MLQNSTISQNKPHLTSMSNKALSAYRMYLAVKLHFLTDKYDLSEHNARVRINTKTFQERNQESLYAKFAERFDDKAEMAQYLVSNFAYGAWGNTDIIYGTAESEHNHKEWKRRKDSITQVFKNDLSKIRLEWEKNNLSKFTEDLTAEDLRVPHLFQMFIGNHITLETMIIIDDLHPYLQHWKKCIGSLFADDIRRMIKAKRFIKYDVSKVKPFFMELVEEI